MSTDDDIERVAESGDVERYRATPLRPAVWMTSMLVWPTVVALILWVPTWAAVFLCIVTGISFLCFLIGYIYLFVTDPEMLRAERYRELKRRGSAREGGSEQSRELSHDRRGYLEPEQPGSVIGLANEGERDMIVRGSSRVADK
jgi:hypothetical protein